ncbi:MAG: hypothetical protein LC723_12795, partial [Actinobacteria bacterium]|nr:hypothetical protein [Actinomycetota bacterium]
VYRRRGAYVVPTFHPAAALRGGRFGGMSPADGIREDLAVVRTVLDKRDEPQGPVPAAVAAQSSEPESQQLGLF